MNAPGLPAALRRLFQVLFRGFLALVVMGALAKCPWEEEDDGGGDGGGGEEPTVVFILDRPLVFTAPGDSVRLELDYSAAVDGIAGFSVETRDDLGTGAPTMPADATFNIRGNSPAVLRIQTGAGTAPGAYAIPLRLRYIADPGFIDRERTLTLVVLPTDATPVAGPVVQVAAGDTHSLALLEDGSVWAWGRNDRGQLGDGTLTDRQVPVPVVGLPGPVQAVAAGGRHSLALLADGTVWGWGDNRERQVTSLSGSPRAFVAPVRSELTEVEHYEGIVAVAAGDAFSLLLGDDGTVWGIGSNARNQLGDPDENPSIHVAQVDLAVVDLVAIAAGGRHSLALGDDGSVWGWGASDRGQLGGAVGTPDQIGPIDVAFIGERIGIGAGLEHTLLIDPDGQVGTLGANGSGQLGDGSRDTPDAQPKAPPFLLNVAQVDGGWLHSLALEADGEVLAWGNNAFGQVSDSGNMTPDGSGRTDQLVPVQVAGVPPSGGIAAGGRHSLSVDAPCGKAWSWGDNIAAQLGDAGVAPEGGFRASPLPVYGLGDDPPAAGCRVLLSAVTVGEGRVTAGNAATPIDDEACEFPCAAHFPAGDTVTLTATPDAGAVFLGWGGNCTGAEPAIDVTMDRARSCRALFNLVPIPSLSIDPNPVEFFFDSSIDFDARASTDPDGEIAEYAWDFEDDGTFDAFDSEATLDDVPPVGTYTARLRVTDERGTAADATLDWTVSTRPVADFTWDPEPPAPGETAVFDGSISTGPRAIVGYEWDFDDDGIFDAAGVVVEHAFATADNYRVLLKVTDDLGFTGFRARTVIVGDGGGPGDGATLTVVPQGEGTGIVYSLVPDGDMVCTFEGARADPNPCTLNAPPGTDVTLGTITVVGSVFSHWGVGDCDSETPGDGSPNCNVTLTGDREVAVFFE